MTFQRRMENRKIGIGEIVEISRSARALCFEWQIDNFFSEWPETERGVISHHFPSPNFMFCSGKWWLSMWLNDSTVDATLCYKNFPRRKPKTMKISIGIRGSCGEVKVDEKELELNRFGLCNVANFPSKPDLMSQKSKFMQSDALIITCQLKAFIKGAAAEIDEDIREAHIDEDQAAEMKATEELTKSLQGLLASQEESDVVLRVKGKEFRAHRSILRARSPVFRAMFTHDMLEKQRGVVTMMDCDPQTFPDFLDHVYTGNIKKISARNVFHLYEASDKYDFATLRNECSKFIKKSMNVSNFCDVITFAIRRDDRELTELATQFFCSNSVDILETAEWQVFLSENPTVGNELFLKLLSKHRDIFRAPRQQK